LGHLLARRSSATLVSALEIKQEIHDVWTALQSALVGRHAVAAKRDGRGPVQSITLGRYAHSSAMPVATDDAAHSRYRSATNRHGNGDANAIEHDANIIRTALMRGTCKTSTYAGQARWKVVLRSNGYSKCPHAPTLLQCNRCRRTCRWPAATPLGSSNPDQVSWISLVGVFV
jgi:hypothetical protein